MAPSPKANVLFAYKALTICAGLSEGARRVAGAIIDHFNHADGQCNPSVERLAEMLGLHRASVMRAIEQLHALGIIHRARHGGRSHRNAYRPNWDQLNRMVAEWDAKMKGKPLLAGASDTPLLASAEHQETVASTRRSRSQSCDVNSRTDATLTYLKNQSNEPKGTCGTDKPQEPPASSPSIEVFKGLLNGNAWLASQSKPKVVLDSDRRIAAKDAAMRRWNRDLMGLGTAAYADAIDKITPEITAEATEAEMRRHGDGVRLIRDRLLSPAAPPRGG